MIALLIINHRKLAMTIVIASSISHYKTSL